VGNLSWKEGIELMDFRKAKLGTSYHGLAIQILEREGRPMKLKEIIKEILELKKTNGKTPGNTISAVLQRSKYFERVGKASYQLITYKK